MKIELDMSAFLKVETLYDPDKNATYFEVSINGVLVERVEEEDDEGWQHSEYSVRVRAEEEMERAIKKLWAMGKEEA